METDSFSCQSQRQKAQILQGLVSGPLASSGSNLSGYSRAIPSDKDFHFYNNFDEFRVPARKILQNSDSSLSSFSSSASLWGRNTLPALPNDLDAAYDWLVNPNNVLLEGSGVSMDEFKNSMERQEEKGSESGFQLDYGKKHKNTTRNLENSDGSLGVKMASKDKKTVGGRSRVPFHMPSIPRPQDQFNILVNNSNQPFEHVWLERSEDGSRFVHPLEKLSGLNFVDRNIRESELVKPPSVENSPFKLVEGVRELKELAAKLRNVNEFAVDLEHNQYRSFQGLTCLIQISTRTEDFVIDTLKLRVQIGPYLREVFKDPSKRKVMHGADRDILWLQRDFGIYVCNLFDTGQASRVMQLERNSLEFLLHYFCGVNANKEYQNADWRLRPLPDEMLKYAREDTHYLLHIYDLMRSRLLSASPDGNCEALLIEVYKRSYEICIQLYEKELLTDSSFLYIYGLQEADFNAQQLAVVAGLCEWRDAVARAEDESTGYILPNKALLEIARHMPLSSGKLRHLVKSNHPYVERYINSVISIIRSSIGSASSFESVAEQLKKGQQEAAHGQHIEAVGYCSGYLQGAEEPMESIVSQKDVLHGVDNARTVQGAENIAASMSAKDNHVKPANTEHFSCQIPRASRCRERERLQPLPLPEIGCFFKLSDTADKTNEEKIYDGNTESSLSAKAANVASVKMLKKPTCAFGVLIGNSSSKKKFDPDKGSTNEQDKADTKAEQIKFSVNLPFHSFSGGERLSEPSLGESINHSHPEKLQQYRRLPGAMELEEVISSGNGMDNSLLSIKIPVTRFGMNDREQLPCHPKNGSLKDLQLKSDTEEDPISLSDLSSSFQKCFQLMNETRKSDSIQFTPFDHADARKHMKFGKVHEGGAKGDDELRTPGSGGIRKGLVFGRAHVEERVGGFQQPRRLPGFSSK